MSISSHAEGAHSEEAEFVLLELDPSIVQQLTDEYDNGNGRSQRQVYRDAIERQLPVIVSQLKRLGFHAPPHEITGRKPQRRKIGHREWLLLKAAAEELDVSRQALLRAALRREFKLVPRGKS